MSTNSMQNDNDIWIEYLKTAAEEDARLVDNWNQVLDVLLVFVGLFLTVLTAFIIQISSNFEPNPAEVTNKILIAIYNHTMNASTPIDLEQFLRLDDSSRKANELQHWLLYTSLILSLMLAVLAMAAKLWVVTYSREVATSGLPHDRSKKRQEIYDGAFSEWPLGKSIEAMAILAMIAVILFGFFVNSFLSQLQEDLLSGIMPCFHVGLFFFAVASYTGAFIPNSPFRSVFSNFVNITSRRILPVEREREWVFWRTTIAVVLISTSLLAAGLYFLLKNDDIYLAFIYLSPSLIGVFGWKGTEVDMRLRVIGLPGWVLISSFVIYTLFLISIGFSRYSTPCCLFFYVLASILLGFLPSIGIKMSKTKPETAEARAVSGVLQKSFYPDKHRAWSDVVRIAEKSPNVRALLLKELFPLLASLIMSDPREDHMEHINILACLLNFEPQERSLRNNQASLKRPRADELPNGFLDKLRELQASREKCSHMQVRGSNNEGSNTKERCPEKCDSDAVEYILRLYGRSEV